MPDQDNDDYVFSLPSRNDLRSVSISESGLIYLKRHIQAFPDDLVAHARRVLVARALLKKEELFAALIDLWIATGALGEALKIRMFKRTQEILDQEQIQYLEATLKTGLTVHAALKNPTESMLASGSRQSYSLVGMSTTGY